MVDLPPSQPTLAIDWDPKQRTALEMGASFHHSKYWNVAFICTTMHYRATTMATRLSSKAEWFCWQDIQRLFLL